jgi:hypothetical protein
MIETKLSEAFLTLMNNLVQVTNTEEFSEEALVRSNRFDLFHSV